MAFRRLTFAQNEVKGNENKVLRHCPVSNETGNADGAGHEPCVDLEVSIHTSGTCCFQRGRGEAAYSIRNQLIHQRVTVFVACLELPEVPGNGQGGQNISQHPQSKRDNGHRLQSTVVQAYSPGRQAEKHARRSSESALMPLALTQRW